ncbi:tetratricopeptide repeat protein [Duganella dendranthematis]|jgi:tetratricopeptide (TPR) repeat protein|uniref:Tetratricopeptide repeat protein n=1 Tax=Duganella dendranthematis TaxID=2728021 RepID=A0ABX6M753_9BURK|nr:tetratricopeptide repeat protein [Duganella dendranthematis]QJD89914.1 tetratricopeptide repeat protein [Duganella dendranthematis]
MTPWARILILCSAAFLSGCASQTPRVAPAQQLFHDQLFQPPTAPIDTASVFALTPEMRDYVKHELGTPGPGRDVRRMLFDALYRRDKLQLEYDAALTRTASETFAARSGNCLSLAIMTAALARELKMPVIFQQVQIDEVWSRAGSLYFASNHVNLSLGRPLAGQNPYLLTAVDVANSLTVDFIPIPPQARENARPLTEKTVLAMYLNNRAAELLSAGQVDDAYWAARQAAEADPLFINAYNTLGVIYQHHGDQPQAEAALRYAQSQLPDNTIYLSNLAQTLESANKLDEAAVLRARLARLEPYPPFYFFVQGQEAMKLGDYARARTLFERELDRVPDYHELHFWLAVANYQLGNLRAADRHMALAMENSTTRGDHDVYSAKLDHLRAYAAQLRAK